MPTPLELEPVACTTPNSAAPDPACRPDAELDPVTRAFYLRSMDVMDAAGIPYVVGGAYALAHYAGIIRHTKDLDLFLKRSDLPRAFEAFERAGYTTELTHPHWLGKAYAGDDVPPGDPAVHPNAFIDLIFRSANGMGGVDDDWIARSLRGDVLGREGPLCPPEEMIWSKAFVMDRNRFDGADVNHLLLACAPTLDWRRLITRFDGHSRVLLAHLVLFGYVYPSERARVPHWVMTELTARLMNEPPASERVCLGTNITWEQYLPDVRQHGYIDGRLAPRGPLTPEEVKRWSEAPK